jgi:uncharacterized membrane protein
MNTLPKGVSVALGILSFVLAFFILRHLGIPNALNYLILTVLAIVALVLLCIKMYVDGLKTKYELEALKNSSISTKQEILASEAKILKRIAELDPKGEVKKPSDALAQMRKEIALSESRIVEQINDLNKREFENFPIFSQ